MKKNFEIDNDIKDKLLEILQNDGEINYFHRKLFYKVKTCRDFLDKKNINYPSIKNV